MPTIGPPEGRTPPPPAMPEAGHRSWACLNKSSGGEPHKQQQQLHVLGASSTIAASAYDQRSIEGFEAVL